jgi:decaprenylphospho-beta-D-ribofuranose 2-oxidase
MRVRRAAPGPSDGPQRQERLLTGWGRTAPTRAVVERPASADGVDHILARSGPRGVITRGLGRSYGDAAQNAGGVVISTQGLPGAVELNGTTGRAQISAGTSLGQLIAHVLPHGWFPAVVPGTQYVSIGGAIASDVHGKNHHRDGSFCEHVHRIELALPDGGRANLTPGGADADAFWATAGGMGLTGVALTAELQLRPVATGYMRVDTTRTADLEESMRVLGEADATAQYTVAWVDLISRGGAFGRGIVTAGEHAFASELEDAGAASGVAVPANRRLASVPVVPGRSGVLHPGTMRLFNELYYRRAPAAPSRSVEPIWGYFFPLDVVGDWNRLYGRAGMLQYQFVIPDAAADRLIPMTERLVADGVPIYLAVLKRLRDVPGPLGFPLRGWTLALDIPAGVHGLAEALDRLDAAVAECGGRVYLAKDARLRAELLPAMYPRLAEWRAVRDRLDPGRVMRSDLDRRLSLVAPQNLT